MSMRIEALGFHTPSSRFHGSLSYARPQLLFAVEKEGYVFFFSSPQNQEADNSSPTTASYHMSFPVNDVREIYSPISGLVCVKDKQVLKGRKTLAIVWVICNPSTGQSFALPRMKTRKRKSDVRSFFGYDPIEKQFKVLAMTWAYGSNAVSQEHQVLTLEAGKVLSWRMIECGVPHYPEGGSICINGVLYYKAGRNRYSSFGGDMMIMSFDVRSEKYSFIKVMKPFTKAVHPTPNLVNYNVKLASLRSSGSTCFSRASTSFEMWVLDDLEKNEWSKHIYKLPRMWRDVIGVSLLHCVGVTDSNEVVLAKHSLHAPFYVYYFSLETETSRIVEIQGMKAFRTHRGYTFVDHVEDVKLFDRCFRTLERR